MTQDDFRDRVIRESKAQPDVSSGYHALLSHANNRYWHADRVRVFGAALSRATDVLEIGCTGWYPYIEQAGLRPRRIVCINIYEPHLDQGVSLAQSTLNKPEFRLMDAHELRYPDASFDTVFGCAILHHLETARAIREFHRVLKPGGKIIFDEPLGTNPLANLIRRLTPGRHTPDEEALSGKHFKIIGERFHLTLHFQQLVTVPAAVVSKLIASTGDNPLMKSAYHADLALLRMIPVIGKIFRYAVIEGVRK